MPAGYAHYIFGQKVLAMLDEQHQNIINNHIELYNIGIHGPDILFYYHALSDHPIKKMGSILHQKEAFEFFSNAKNVIKKHHEEDYIAYIYGFITHFVLDHACHGYISQMEQQYQMTHSEIESELDRKLLVNQHLNPLKTCLTNHIQVSYDNATIIAPFFQLKEKDIYQSLKSLLFYLGWIDAPGKVKRHFVYCCMKIAGIYDEYHGLLISYKENQKSQKDISYLINLLEESTFLAKELIEEFDSKPLSNIYHHNFE